ncbi:hypothetical protein RUND412_003924 [Rhizina undulata]
MSAMGEKTSNMETTSTPPSSHPSSAKAQKRVKVSDPDTANTSTVPNTTQGLNRTGSGDGLVPAILLRRSTLPSARTGARRFLRNLMRRRRPIPGSEAPSLSTIEPQLEEDGVPASRGNIEKITLDPNLILKAALAHKVRVGGLSGLLSDDAFPEYDALSNYSVTEKAATDLVNREITRSVTIVHNPSITLRFAKQQILKAGYADGYKKLSSLS